MQSNERRAAAGKAMQEVHEARQESTTPPAHMPESWDNIDKALGELDRLGPGVGAAARLGYQLSKRRTAEYAGQVAGSGIQGISDTRDARVRGNSWFAKIAKGIEPNR